MYSRQEALHGDRTIGQTLAHSLLALLMLSAADDAGARRVTMNTAARHLAQPHKPTQQKELVQAVRDATARFKNVSSVDGPGEGYALMFGCVSGGDFGAMGLHYVKGLAR